MASAITPQPTNESRAVSSGFACVLDVGSGKMLITDSPWGGVPSVSFSLLKIIYDL
jgi:hypothetical protein